MKENQKVFLWAGGFVALVVVSYYLYKKFKKPIVGSDNYNLLLVNEPTAKATTTPTQGNVIRVDIGKDAFAIFYPTNRFFLYKIEENKRKEVARGTYLNGGRYFKKDGDTKEIKGNDVLANIKNYL